MLSILGVVFLVALAVLAYAYFGGSKLANRLKCRAEDAQENLADKVGSVIDDRNVKIKEGEEAHGKITEQLVKLMTEINVNGERVEKDLETANKYTNIAKKAKEDGNMEAAREALVKATVAEESANAYKNAVERLEEQRDTLINQRDKLSSNIDNAKANTAIFQARYSAAALQSKMLKSDSFGGAGNFDFSADDEVLLRMEAENDARSAIDEKPDSALVEYNKQVDNDALTKKLESL